MTIDTEINPRPHIGQMSVDATLLAKRLSACAQGETVFYSDLTSISHRNIRGDARYILYTARKSCMRESKIVFGTVHGVGLRRLTDEEIAESFHAPIRHIRMTANKAGHVVACADTSKLSPEKQRAVSVGLSVTGAIALFSCTKSVALLDAAAKSSPTPAKIDMGEMVALFAAK
jgi:hypothetical protein